MILATHQPIFLPWPGFFHKALRADRLVLLDEVQFPLGRGWLTRNRLKSAQGELWLSVPVRKKGRAGQRISEVELCEQSDWRYKHLESLRQHYAHAPYLDEYLPPIETVYAARPARLLDHNLALIEALAQPLGLGAKLHLQSRLAVTGKGTDLLLALCDAVGADTYLTLPPAEKYLDLDRFRAHGIAVRYAPFHPPVHPQLWGPFRYNLSTLDLLLTCGSKARPLIERAGDRSSD